MSGPKDYSVFFSAARLLAQAVRQADQAKRRNEQLRERAAENRRRLAQKAQRLRKQAAILNQREDASVKEREENIEDSTSRLKMQNSNRSESIDDRLEAMAEANRQRLESEQEKWETRASGIPLSPATAGDETIKSNAELNALISEREELADNTDSEIETKIQETMLRVMQWHEQLESDDDVSDFQKQPFHQWAIEQQQWLHDAEQQKNDTKLLERSQSLLEQAEQIHNAAGEFAAKFTTRNELVGDIIASLKEVGFVVNDPTFQDVANPSGPVLLVASRGSETMQASIDLSEQIQSTWDNLSDEHCKTAFFDYVDAMGAKGVEVKPEREDLRQRPIIRQKSAKDLPRGKSGNA